MTKKIKGWNSPMAIHPGEMLADFILDYKPLGIEGFANKSGLELKVVKKILNGSQNITKEIAQKIADVEGFQDKQFWLDMQRYYEKDIKRLSLTKNNYN